MNTHTETHIKAHVSYLCNLIWIEIAPPFAKLPNKFNRNCEYNFHFLTHLQSHIHTHIENHMHTRVPAHKKTHLCLHTCPKLRQIDSAHSLHNCNPPNLLVYSKDLAPFNQKNRFRSVVFKWETCRNELRH